MTNLSKEDLVRLAKISKNANAISLCNHVLSYAKILNLSEDWIISDIRDVWQPDEDIKQAMEVWSKMGNRSLYCFNGKHIASISDPMNPLKIISNVTDKNECLAICKAVLKAMEE